jgi:hypothetical protein
MIRFFDPETPCETRQKVDDALLTIRNNAQASHHGTEDQLKPALEKITNKTFVDIGSACSRLCDGSACILEFDGPTDPLLAKKWPTDDELVIIDAREGIASLHAIVHQQKLVTEK